MEKLKASKIWFKLQSEYRKLKRENPEKAREVGPPPSMIAISKELSITRLIKQELQKRNGSIQSS